LCKYSDIINTGYVCPHESIEDSDYCIFHLQDDKKDFDEFNKRIKEILETEEYFINLSGFYFPPDTANFSNAKFKGYADFKNAKFKGHADFTNAQFLGTADFTNAQFLGTADFSDAEFIGEAIFYPAIFIWHAKFIDVTFSREVNFTDVTFVGDAEFWKSEFKGDAYFIDVTFSGKTKFKLARFKEIFKFSPINNSEIGFTSVHFSDNVRIKADMSKCSFANSNIERVDMTDSIWIRDEKPKPKNSYSSLIERIRNKVGLPDTSIKIWEEHQGELKSDWKELEGIYRRLKQSYQKYGDYSTAGKFYYQEMECKRKQLKWFRKLFRNVFYKKLCGYGEKPENVIFASLFLIILFAFSFLFGGIEFVGSNVLKVPPNVIDYNLSLNSFGIQWAMSNIDSIYEDLKLCLYTSVITFTTLGYGDVHPIGFSRIVASVEAGFGIIMTALFIFVFTRKMLR
jgi:hypothetical protein